MRKALFAVALLFISATTVRAQSSFTLLGCDGLRACAQLTFDEDLTAQSRYIVYWATYTLTFYEKGGALDCSWGCAWDVTPMPFLSSEARRAPSACFVRAINEFNRLDGADCLGTYSQRTQIGALDRTWIPLQGEGRVVYDATFYDAPPTTIRMNLVPEPSTYALMAAGLGALALLRRRRRLT